MASRFLHVVISMSILSWFGVSALAQQQRFHKQMPAGNYSGICPLGDHLYAIADDKAETDGFHVVRLDIDSVGQRIVALDYQGYRSSGLPNRDMEGICYRPASQTLFISGEQDNEVYEYDLDGQRTGRRLLMPDSIRLATSNCGLEGLTYDVGRHLFYATTECPLPGETMLRIMAFGDDLALKRQYLYQPDEPISRKYTIRGVSALCALDDGRLLVLERQVRIPRMKIGATAINRIYMVVPADEESLQKTLLSEIKTRFNLTSRQFANYEGLCQVAHALVLLIADSQSRYKGLLRDWFRLQPIRLK